MSTVATCDGEPAFASYRAAERIAARRRRARKLRLYVYRCPGCRRFHIGFREKYQERRT